MKKISIMVIAVVSSLFYLACSTEEAVKTSESNAIAYRLADPDVPVAKLLYSDMMATTEYANFKASMSAFNTKLKHNTVTFDTKAEWVDWINDSISTTDFTDKTEFELMYDDMADKFSIMVDANKDLFEYIADADADQIHEIYQPEYDSYTVAATANECQEGCMDWFDGVVDLLQNILESSIEIANTYSSFPYVQEEAIMNAHRAYDRAYISNALLYNSCWHNCQ